MKEVTPKEARQGRSGKRTLYILVASLAILLGLYFVGEIIWR